MTALVADNPVLARFDRLRRLPAGGVLIDAAVAVFAPYNSAVGVHVVSLSAGHARTRMKDRFWRRNHLGSVHAMALAGLGEITANLALLSALPAGASMIVGSYSIDYLKKARGTLSAECILDPADVPSEGELTLVTIILDGAGDVVARSTQLARVRGGRGA